MYRQDGNYYIYDGDFTDFLNGIGVEAEHINAMKEKILQPDKDDYYEPENERKIEVVPLNKVIGTLRGTVGKSVYENVRCMEMGEREPSRFASCFGFLDKMTLTELKKSYADLYYPVKMEYYQEDDEYYLCGDGNHRTLTAMLLGADGIRANVCVMHCNFEKKRIYNKIEAFKQKYNIFQVHRSFVNLYNIDFYDDEGTYRVAYYEVSNNSDIDLFLDALGTIIIQDSKKINFIEKFPDSIKKLMYRLCSNKRLVTYVNKKKPNGQGLEHDIFDIDNWIK